MDLEVALYDVSRSYYEGRTCPLARFGHDREGGTGRPIIVYGVLTNGAGRPIAVDVYPGDTADPTTVADQLAHLRDDFGLARIVVVGNRGLVTAAQVRRLQTTPGFGWLTVLRSPAIRALVDSGTLQLSLFDQQHLAEIQSPDYPGERLVACFNPRLADERRRKREVLLASTERALTAVAASAARRTRTPFDDATLAARSAGSSTAIRWRSTSRGRLATGAWRRAWAPLLFDDESLPTDRWTRDPVAPAAPSAIARRKKATRQTDDGLPVHSFATLLANLATQSEVVGHLQADPTVALREWAPPTPLQAKALALVKRVQYTDT